MGDREMKETGDKMVVWCRNAGTVGVSRPGPCPNLSGLRIMYTLSIWHRTRASETTGELTAGVKNTHRRYGGRT